jgi:hypothetical protein
MSDDNWFDPDIDAMQLGWGEKAGLQIYRNYTTSFENHALGQLRKALNHETLDLSELAKLVELIVTEDLRFIPIILCAFGDSLLEHALKSVIPEGVPGGKARLFTGYGPLSDLSKRIQMACAFDIVSADLVADLDRVRATRNKISHSWDISAFSEFYSTGRVSDLFPIEAHLAERASQEPELGTVLEPGAAFRVRAIWLAGRLNYEAAFYGLAKRARLSPTRALYEGGGTQWLGKISAICMDATRAVVKRERTS